MPSLTEAQLFEILGRLYAAKEVLARENAALAAALNAARAARQPAETEQEAASGR